MGPSTEDNLPNIASRQCFTVFEPLDHIVDKLGCDAEFAVFKGSEFGTRVGCSDIAAACEVVSRHIINESNWRSRTFGYYLETPGRCFFFEFEFDSLRMMTIQEYHCKVPTLGIIYPPSQIRSCELISEWRLAAFLRPQD